MKLLSLSVKRGRSLRNVLLVKRVYCIMVVFDGNQREDGVERKFSFRDVFFSFLSL